MKIAISLLALVFLASGTVTAQEETIELQLKTGDSFEGKLVKNDEDGVTLDVDGTQLFIRWAYTRGDKHFELRKKATNFRSAKSVIKLADFCHEFAMDEEESHMLVAALKLKPGNPALLKRLEALPKVEGLKIPGKEDPVPEDPTPEDPNPEDPTPEDPEVEDPPPPTPTKARYKVFLECDDSVAKDWLEDHIKDYQYKLGHKRDYFVRVEVEVKLILIKNPKFMGAELYAIYDAEATYKMYKKGEKKAFADETFKTKDVRRDTRAEAIKAVRTRVLDNCFSDLYDDLERQR
ncbi:MAG: hypothetical protein ACYTDT_11925 [Planctomycetota bacterium]|jgi:hypothetical protein